MQQSFSRYIAIAALVFLPVSVTAGEYDFILGDLDRFEQDVQWQIDAEVRAMEDHEFQKTEKLFLTVEDEEDKADEEGIAKANSFVTVKVNGIPVSFKDVPTDAWFAPYVRSAAEDNVISGYRDVNGRLLGSFGPADDVTIEQLAKMALQAAGVVVQDCAGTPLNSTATGSWSAHFIACAETLEWAVYSDGSVDVQRPATRSEVVVTLLQAFDVSFGRGEGELFDDVTTSTEFSGAIELAAEDGMVSGYTDEDGIPTGEFGPLNSVNRAEVAKMVTLGKSIYGN